MKINKTFILLLTLIFNILFISCIEDGKFTVPESLGNEENKKLNEVLDSIKANKFTLLSISKLKNDYYTSKNPKQVTGNIVVKGYVTSSDASGNFFKEFFIQDTPENPNAGIKVALNLTNYHNKFNFGREIYIKLKNLYIGETRGGDGVVTIGGHLNSRGDGVDAISVNQIPNHLFRSTTTATIKPLETTFSSIGSSNIGMFVKVNKAQFPLNLKGEAYFDPTRDFDTQRELKACEGFGYTSFLLETSSFSNFGSVLLPVGGGSISAIVNKSYDGKNMVLSLNNVKDVDMNGAKCIPLDMNDFTVIINEDFQTATNNTNLDIKGWVNYAEKGNKLWKEQVFRGNGYAEFSAFRTKDAVNKGWLVSPAINIGTYNNVYLNFKAAQHHLKDPKNTLEVLVSTDFDGTNITSASWVVISATLPTKNDSWYQFKDAGLINLSNYTENLYIAFKYTGSGKNTKLDGSYMMDDFKILVK